MTTRFPPSPIDRNNVSDQAERLNVLSRDEALRRNLADSDPNVQFKAANTFANQAHAVMPSAHDMAKAGVVSILVSFLSHADPKIQYESLSSLTKVAAVSSDYAKVVVEQGTVPMLIALFDAKTDISEQAVNALGTIASGNPVARDMALDQDALEPLLTLIGRTAQHSSMLRTAVWALSNLCGGIPLPEYEKVSSSLPTLVRLINSVDEEVIASSCWAFAYIVHLEKPETHSILLKQETPEDYIAKIQAVLDGHVARRLVDLLTHRSMAVQLPAVKTVGNIALGNEDQIQVLLDNQVLTHLEPLLHSPRVQVRAETCRAIGNIAKGNQEQIQAVIDSNLVPKLMILTSHDSVQVIKEVIIVFSNILKGSDEQVQYLVNQGCVQPLCDHVLASNSDAGQVFRALEAVEDILKVGRRIAEEDENPYTTLIRQAGGIERFDLLQFHNNKHLYHKSDELLHTYFGGTR